MIIVVNKKVLFLFHTYLELNYKLKKYILVLIVFFQKKCLIRTQLKINFTNYVAEVIRNFEPIVRDTVTMPGNVAVFNCHIPGVSYNENNMLPESVAITSWVQDGVFNIFPSWEIGK